MRISDWSSDVCSSDLGLLSRVGKLRVGHRRGRQRRVGDRGRRDQQRKGHEPLHRAPRTAAAIAATSSGRMSPICWSRSEVHTSELQSLMRFSSAVFFFSLLIFFFLFLFFFLFFFFFF